MALSKLPVKIERDIISYLDDVPGLLTSRLVSKSWNAIVEAKLAQMTHVRLNQDVLDDSQIPNILFDELKVLNFWCLEKNYPLLFAFLAKKCPKLQVVSTSAIKCDDWSMLPSAICYSEVNSHSTNDFCACTRKGGSYRYPFVINSQNDQSLSQYFYDRLWCIHVPELPETLQLPACISLRILILTSRSRQQDDLPAPNFNFPNLKHIRCNLKVHLAPFIGSLGHSPQLRVIEIKCIEDDGTFLPFANSLKHLKFLKINQLRSDKEELLVIPPFEAVELLSLGTKEKIAFSNSRHESLKYLHLDASYSGPPINLPSVSELSLVLSENKVIDGLLNPPSFSRRLKMFNLVFTKETRSQVNKFAQFIYQLHWLREVRIKGTLNDSDGEDVLLDFSKNYELERLLLDLLGPFSLKMPKLMDDSPYDEVVYEGNTFILRRKRCKYRFLLARNAQSSFNSGRITFLPQARPTSQYLPQNIYVVNDFRSFGYLTILIDSQELFDELLHMIPNMPNLKGVSLRNCDFFNVTLHELKCLLRELCQKSSLESLELDLSIQDARRNESDEVAIDATLGPSLENVKVKLQMNDVKSKVVFNWTLGNFYKRLAIVDRNSFDADLIDGRQLKALLPEHSELSLPEPMKKLESLCITNWSLIKDDAKFLKACNSVESLHMNDGDQPPSSIIPALITFGNLKNLSGPLSPTFLKMFISRSAYSHLNMDPAYKSIIEGIQEDPELPFEISWIES